MKSRFLPSFHVSGEDLQHRYKYFRKEYYVKTVSQPDIDALFLVCKQVFTAQIFWKFQCE